jgi:hypothetical protein
MVKTTLNLKNGINIEKVSKLRAFLKRQNDGYTPKKSRVLTKEQVDRFLNFAPDNKYLMMKVLCRPKNFGRHCLSVKKKNIVIRTLLSS